MRKILGADLLSTLVNRKTVRDFATQQKTTLDDVASLLDLVWGTLGVVGEGGNLVVKKTSPSAGALHPTEVYPLVLRVEGLEPGIYHYRVADRDLETLETMDLSRAEDLADLFCAGQFYPRGAHVLFIMCTRFERNFWSYRKHPKAYRTLLLDVGHLSQTFYLVCTALGLGPFFTSAINDIDIDRELGLDSSKQSAIGICGCGIPADKLIFSLSPEPPTKRG